MFPHSEQKIEFICNFGKSLVKKKKNKENNTHLYKTILTVVSVQKEPNMKNRVQPTQSLSGDVMSSHRKRHRFCFPSSGSVRVNGSEPLPESPVRGV